MGNAGIGAGEASGDLISRRRARAVAGKRRFGHGGSSIERRLAPIERPCSLPRTSGGMRMVRGDDRMNASVDGDHLRAAPEHEVLAETRAVRRERANRS